MIEEDIIDTASTPYQRPITDDSLGSLQYQLDNTDVIQEIEQTLRNARPRYTRDGNIQWIRATGQTPLINDQGINNVLSIARSRLTKVMILSDLEKSDIIDMVQDIHEDLTDDFFFNWTNYQIRDPATASLIIALVTDNVYATLRKAYLGGYMKSLRSMHTIQEIQQGSIQRKKTEGDQSIGGRLTDMLFRKRR